MLVNIPYAQDSPRNRGLSKPNVNSSEAGRHSLEAPVNALPIPRRATHPWFALPYSLPSPNHNHVEVVFIADRAPPAELSNFM